MTRLPPALIRRAAHENPLLPLLLRVCRDLPSARNELRWLEEYAQETVTVQRRRLHNVKGLSGGKLEAQNVPGRHGAKILRNSLTGRSQGEVPSNRCSVTERNFSTSHGPLATQPTLGSRGPKQPTLRKYEVSHKSNNKGNSSAEKKLSKGAQRRAARRNLSKPNHPSVDAPPVRKGTISQPMRKGIDHPIRKFLTKAVYDRSRGKPLQHILGNQPFGSLEILTPNTVLIPRPETEAFTEYIANLVLSAVHETNQKAGHHEPEKRRKLRILDLCTGSGCIALLLHSILKPPNPSTATPGGHSWPSTIDLEILGVDYHSTALEVANRNLHYNISKGLLHSDAATDISFMRQDVIRVALDTKGRRDPRVRRIFNLKTEIGSVNADPPHDDGGNVDANTDAPWDIVISNPPYISERDYAPGGTTEPSVRKFEPKTALVPENSPSVHSGDLFYWPLTRIFDAVGARLLVMELGGAPQAARVNRILTRNFGFQARRKLHTLFLECWKDDGTLTPLSMIESSNGKTTDTASAKSKDAPDRALFLWSGPLAAWRRDQVGDAGGGVSPQFHHLRPIMSVPMEDHQRRQIPPFDLVKARKPVKSQNGVEDDNLSSATVKQKQ
ncbi:hypothetical protein PV08_01147 [Exophiala spinifera]|uniref:Methyltransferase domain-containing protein n=1 Tax=Exophiala spinifera TaxID=91928 RepID=A0A0D2A739_9EURO|nr:uncharacterized protein PV08_01147 [Exophiala spinifera]KIW20572.1 hypothetical protein PV08_01147 [Exophiala spinifera]